MKKSGIETNITLVAIFIALAVAVSGTLVYRSLTEIVNSIHNEASSDKALIVIKDISIDLLELENSIEIYTLTRSLSDLDNFNTLHRHLKERIGVFSELKEKEGTNAILLDSVQYLVESKLKILEEIKQINRLKTDQQSQFNQLYSMLEKKEIDTVKVKVLVEPPKKKGFFKKIFGKKDTAYTRIDTTYVERTVENEEIKEEIEELETGLRKQVQRKNRRELELTEQNILVSGKLNNLIAQIETAERDRLIEKNNEADRLATLIYKRLLSFSIMAVILLFFVLLLSVRYLWKAKKVEKALTNAKQEAEKLAQAKEVFMANVSHEMRTPVNAIHGLTEQLLNVNTSGQVNEKLGILLKSSKHLKEVVNDTLDFSKIQANKLKITTVDFAPEKIISEILALLEPEASAKGIELIYTSESKMPAALLGDPFRLKQVLINIIGNAVKFTEKGKVELIAESKQISKSLFSLRFKVIDTGIGISKENQELIFEDFVQIESDYTRKFSGTGLGLSIVKKLVELQKGEISISSELGKGTNVSFYIPYQLGNPEKIEPAKQEDLVVPVQVKHFRILGVDDDEYNRYLLRVIFEKWELTNYTEAKNGKEAVKIALEHEFDIILMDLRMPDLNGIEASKLITEKKPDVTVIALATINSEAEKEICKKAGISYFLSKPFAEAELLDIILEALKNREKIEPENPGFDLKELERLTNGDRGFMQEMIKVFIRSSQSGIESMKKDLETENWQQISEEAHKMASPCKHIKADDLYADLKQLEKVSANQDSLLEISDLILSVEKKVKKINTSLSAILASGL
uniref:hybrid sensor histidine kinase/response regulator n=1 Tax=uncultured Draconibacterium sp. TaxID=1573823 RepID=UPI00321667B7